MSKRIAVLAGVIATAMTLAAPAGAAPPKIRRMPLTVEVTGVQVTDWEYQNLDEPSPTAVWQKGKGTQTLGFSTRRPVLANAVAMSGSIDGRKLPPFELALVTRKPLLRGSLRRSYQWDQDEPRPACEGGPRFCPTTGKQDVQLPFACPRISPKVPYKLEVTAAGAMRFEFQSPSRPYAFCPPDHLGGFGQPGTSRESLRLSVGNAVERLSRLQPGGKVTLKKQVETNFAAGKRVRRCQPVDREGYNECVVLDVTVEVRWPR